MAHIFKHPQKNSKGILLFTHKEVQILSIGILTYKNFIYYYYRRLIFILFLKPKYMKIIDKIKFKYFIGIHIGGNITHPIGLDFLDFCMGFKKCKKIFDKLHFIPITSRNFTPNFFLKKNENDIKYYDFFSVTRITINKNLSASFDTIRKLYDNNYNYKFLIIALPGSEEDNRKIFKEYYSKFNTEERHTFHFIIMDEGINKYSMHQETLVNFYKKSKVFFLFSEEEGEPRVIQEALYAGLPIICYKYQKGGGLDNLSNINSIMFESFGEAWISFIESIKKYDFLKKNTLKLIDQSGYEDNFLNLKNNFKHLYEKENLQYDFELINEDNLNFRLPAHFRDIKYEWMVETNKIETFDIINRSQLKMLLRHLKVKYDQ